MGELQSNYLPDLAIDHKIEGAIKNIEKTDIWKVIKQINAHTEESKQVRARHQKTFTLVLAPRTLLDVWQGCVSGICLGDYPEHLSKRENIITVKMVKDGEMFGAALLMIQDGRAILISLNPSESFASSISRETEKQFVDEVMTGLAEIAKVNSWELLIGNPDEAGGLANRGGMKEYIVEKYIEGSKKSR